MGTVFHTILNIAAIVLIIILTKLIIREITYALKGFDEGEDEQNENHTSTEK